MSGQFALHRLMLSQHLARPRDYFIRQARQLGDFDAIAAVGRSRLNLTQENDPAARLFHRDVIVLHSRKLLSQLRELKIVGSEQGLGTYTSVEILDRSPCNR